MASKEDHYTKQYRTDAERVIIDECNQIDRIDKEIARLQEERNEHAASAIATIVYEEIRGAIVGNPQIKVDSRGFVTVNVKFLF